MADMQSNLVRDGKGAQIKFPVFISQADMDLIEKEFVVKDGAKDVATSTYFHNQSKLGYEGTWEDHLQLFLNGDVGFGPYFEHVLP